MNRPLVEWQKWQSQPNVEGHVTFATIHCFHDRGGAEERWIRYSYAEETGAGVFSGGDDCSTEEFRRKFPVWREDPPDGEGE